MAKQPRPERTETAPRRWDRLPLMIAGVALALGWLGFLISDVLNVAQLRDRVVEPLTDRPLFFLWFFDEAGPVEMLQWAMLIVSIVAAANIAKKAYRVHDTREFRVFLLGIIGLGLMYLEDTLNIRHLLSFHVTMPLFYEGDLLKNNVRTATELAFYTVVGGTMIGFLWRSFPRFRRADAAHLLLVAGYACYAVAAVASATRYIGDWYERLGAVLAGMLAPGVPQMTLLLPTDEWTLVGYDVGFFLMDYLVEETLELVGAAALAAALLRVTMYRVS